MGAILNAVLAAVTVLSGILSVFGLFQSGETLLDVGGVVTNNSNYISTFYDSILEKLGFNFSSMVSGIDTSLSGATSSVCSPACTLSYILKITGIGYFLSGCLYCLFNVAIFRFNLFVFRLCLIRLSLGKFGGFVGSLGKK